MLKKDILIGGYAPLGYKVVTVDYGTYKKKKLEIDPISSKAVVRAFELRAEETKFDYIIDILNKEGYKNINGKEFTRNSLQTLFKNKRYIGTNLYNDEEFPNTIPAIIDKKLFDKVQQIAEKHKKKSGKSKAKVEYLLSSKLICNCCGGRMRGISGKGKSGEIYRYYSCKNHKKCKTKMISKDVIENLIINQCKQLLNDKNINMIAKRVYEVSQKENDKNLVIKEYESQVKTIEKAIDNLLKAVENGTNIDLINNRLTEKRKELEDTKMLLAQERNKVIEISEEHIKFFLSQLKEGNVNDIKYRKKLINMFVNQIYVREKDVLIIFNVSKQKISLPVSKTDKENIDILTFLKGSYKTVVVSQQGFEPRTPGL